MRPEQSGLCENCEDFALCNADFGVSSVDLPQGFADFPYGGVGAYGVDDIGHGIGARDIVAGAGTRFLRRGFLERLQRPPHFLIRAAGAQSLQFRRLLAAYRFVDVKNVRGFLFDDELIDADDDLFARLDRALVLVRGFGNFFLRISAFDGFDHAAHSVELAEVIEGAIFHLQR